MKRFPFHDLPDQHYDLDVVAGMSNEELANELNTCDWDLDLLRDLIWRALQVDPSWVRSPEGPLMDDVYKAADILGVHLN